MSKKSFRGSLKWDLPSQHGATIKTAFPFGLPEHGLGHARIFLSVEVPREAVNGADFQATGFIVLELIAPARFTVLVGSLKTIARGYEAGRIPEPRWKER